MANLQVCMSDLILVKAADAVYVRSARAALNAEIVQKNLTPC